MNKFTHAFYEGFVGSFVLAYALVLALISVTKSFVNGTLSLHDISGNPCKESDVSLNIKKETN